SSTPLRTTAPLPASQWVAARLARWTSTCAGSAESCPAIPRSRRQVWPPACSVTRHSVWPGLPTKLALTVTHLSPATSCSLARLLASSSRKKATRFMPTFVNSAGSPLNWCEIQNAGNANQRLQACHRARKTSDRIVVEPVQQHCGRNYLCKRVHMDPRPYRD